MAMRTYETARKKISLCCHYLAGVSPLDVLIHLQSHRRGVSKAQNLPLASSRYQSRMVPYPGHTGLLTGHRNEFQGSRCYYSRGDLSQGFCRAGAGNQVEAARLGRRTEDENCKMSDLRRTSSQWTLRLQLRFSSMYWASLKGCWKLLYAPAGSSRLFICSGRIRLAEMLSGLTENRLRFLPC